MSMNHGLRRALVGLLLGSVFVTVWTRPHAQENLFELALANTRADQETLADRVFGLGVRPEDWLGTDDFDNPAYLADLWFDNERMADALYGQGTRPEDWISATTQIPDLVARNIRHDLELMADTEFGTDLRPAEWIGAGPLPTCDRTLLNAVYLLDTVYDLRPTTSEGVVNYCETLGFEIEDNLIEAALGAPQQVDDVPALILAVRGDLERLADEIFGVNTRPRGWLDNTDVQSPSLAVDIFTDLTTLADTRLGLNERPAGWISSPIGGSQVNSFRNLRFNLELITDALLGEGNRPTNWQGTDPLNSCEPSLQNLVFLVQNTYQLTLPPPTVTNYCAEVAQTTNLLVENPPQPEQIAPGEATEEIIFLDDEDRFVAESSFAFSYLDPAALEYMGTMPGGVQFRAWYRNFGESTMMFVSGEGFAVFIDRRFTTLSQAIFNSLPTLEGVRPLTFCDASWCNGPGPTPTPTGFGPLLDLVLEAELPQTVAPTAIVIEGGDNAEEAQEVDFAAIRTNILLEVPVGQEVQAQVTLEICTSSAQVACEPVIRITNQTTGQEVPPISTLNGLNVYQLPFGFSGNFLIEGANLFSNEIFIDDPSALGE